MCDVYIVIVSHLFFSCGLGKAVLRDCGIAWVASHILEQNEIPCPYFHIWFLKKQLKKLSEDNMEMPQSQNQSLPEAPKEGEARNKP